MIVRRSLFRSALVVICAAVAVSAQFVPQNARMNGLAGTFIMDDMNDVLRYSAYLDQYKDGAQATFNGPIMGFKSIGDVFSVGVVANRGLLLDQSSANVFYTIGGQALTGPAGFAALTPATPATQNVPHLLFCANLSALTIGVDAFFEYASSTIHHESAADPSVISDTSVRIHNPGLIASARFGSEDVPITAKFGFGIPKIHGKYNDGTTEVEVNSEFGRFITFGGEVSLPAADFQLALGLDWNFEGYAFSIDGATPGAEYHNNRLANYIGLQGDLFTSAKWGAMYTMKVLNGNTISATDTTKNRTLEQIVSCGLENSWQSVWVFDECFVRGGLNYVVGTPIRYNRNATSGSSRIRSQTRHDGVVPNVGIGVKKSMFQLDVTVNPTEWAGVVAGPEVGTVTLTVIF